MFYCYLMNTENFKDRTSNFRQNCNSFITKDCKLPKSKPPSTFDSQCKKTCNTINSTNSMYDSNSNF